MITLPKELEMPFVRYGVYPDKIGKSELIRWTTIDPLWEKYHGCLPTVVKKTKEGSPYNYTLNNPLWFIDPDGKEVDNILNEMLGDDGKFFAEKPKPQKAQKSQKVKSTRKSPTPTFTISISGSAAALFGYNGSIGFAINPGQGKLYGFVRHGMSAGAALSGSVSIGIADQDIEETRASGSGLKIAPKKNTTEVEGGIGPVGGSIILNS